MTDVIDLGTQRSSAGAIVRNEFAAVRVDIDRSAHSPRLKIADLQSGDYILLDALELASLASATHAMLHFLHDPSLIRWRTIDSAPCDDDGGAEL